MTVKKPTSKKTLGYRDSLIIKKSTKPQYRLMIGIPSTGTIRLEWAMARWGQVIPCNWSATDHIQWLDQWSPIDFMVADARNVIATNFVEANYEWLFFIDHDVLLPPMFFVHLNEIMIRKKYPIYGGVYFTKSVPAEPLIYRGRGNGYYPHWKFGDKVWVDGMGLGCHIIHSSILKTLYEDSEEYVVAGQRVRKIFETPSRIFLDPETLTVNTQVGTEDLEFYSRIIREDVLARSGWKSFARRKFPYLCDTGLFCYHMDQWGLKYPSRGEQGDFVRK